MKEALYEIEGSNDLIEIVISAEKEFFRLSSFGVIGDTHVKIVLIHFDDGWSFINLFLVLRLIFQRVQSLLSYLTAKKLRYSDTN